MTHLELTGFLRSRSEQGVFDKLRWGNEPFSHPRKGPHEQRDLRTVAGVGLRARVPSVGGPNPSASKQASTALAPYLKQSKERGERGFLDPAGTVVEVLDPAAVLADVPQVKVVSVKLLDPEGK